MARRAGESWGDAWSERAAHDDARVLAEGLERSIDAIRDAWESFRRDRGRSSPKFSAKARGPGGGRRDPPMVLDRQSGSSLRRDLDDVDDDDGVRSGLNESRLDEECVNALVGAEGAAQALGLVPPPPHVGPVESAAYERDRAERAGYVAAVLAAARDAIVGNPHETMRALGRSGDGAKDAAGEEKWAPGDGDAAGDEKWAPGDGDAAGDEKWAPGDGDGDGAGSDWRPGIGGAGLGFGDEIRACAVCVEEGADFLDGEGCTVSAAARARSRPPDASRGARGRERGRQVGTRGRQVGTR